MKAFIIGDIHGCLEEFQELIKDIDRTKTRIICVGDLIDRGNNSEGVIDFIRSNNIETVKGNHELMAQECLPNLIKYIADPSSITKYMLYESDWFYNGGHDVFNQYKENSSLEKLVQDIKWLANLLIYIETGVKNEDGLELLVSHTWMSHKDLEVAGRREFSFLWDRDQPSTTINNSKYYNIFGHTPVDYVHQHIYHKKNTPAITPKPSFTDGTCNIDTGCAYNTRGRGTLSGIFFPSLDVRQIKLKV